MSPRPRSDTLPGKAQEAVVKIVDATALLR